MHHDITGVLLAGGRSSRMGCDKALLQLGGDSMIKHAADLLRQVFGEVILIADDAAPYAFLQLPAYPDIHQKRGPLGGVHAALVHARAARIFVISCDMPLMKPFMIEHIIAAGASFAICVPRADGFLQHLCGLYDKSVTGILETILGEQGQEARAADQGRRGCPFARLLREAGGHVVDVQHLLTGDDALMFANMNEPREVERIRAHLAPP